MNLGSIKSWIRRIVLGHDVNTYYFSQSGEDAILKGFFYHKLEKREKGFFIDIGAYHPTHGNNTYFFYINGWNGINVDAAPGSMEPFKKIRKRDINIETGIAKTEGNLNFYYLGKNNSMNSFSKKFIVEDRKMEEAVQKVIQIPTIRLDTLLDKYLPANQKIDFMSIDVEGMDIEILESNNWEKYSPNVIVVEMQAKMLKEVFDNRINSYLNSLGYEPYAKTLLGGNLASVIYAHNSYAF